MKQLAFQLGRHRYIVDEQLREDQEFFKIASNSMMNEFYLRLAKDLDVVEPKTPDQVYKAHLEEHKT